MILRAKVRTYVFCQCGEALTTIVSESQDSPGEYDIVVKPCSCQVKNHLMDKYGLKTAEEVYNLGFVDGKIALEYEQRIERKGGD